MLLVIALIVWVNSATLIKINKQVSITPRGIVVGIIDYLQEFTKIKQAESLVKGLVSGSGEEPCVVAPSKYKDRFRSAAAWYFPSLS